MNYEEKDKGYYSNVRLDLIGLINSKNKDLKILEIGAAYGETLFYLKENGIASEVVGVDLFEDLDNKENYKKVDRFIFGNIEQIDLEEYLDYFDIILLPDVLEHLLEPKLVLNKLKKYLKKDGKIIVSMPNIRHYSALVKIFLKGDFKYEESGIFDYTHIRFYCRKNIKELFELCPREKIQFYGRDLIIVVKPKLLYDILVFFKYHISFNFHYFNSLFLFSQLKYSI